MANNGRKAFDFDKPWRKKYWNRFDIPTRISLGIAAVIFITSIDIIVSGFQNSSIEELKHNWIRTQVKDIHNKDFASLDEEKPPQPLIPKTNIHRFKEEFTRKYM
jgi:hypothetical protein